jgi:transcriptional regulator with XRE-family HTH domain
MAKLTNGQARQIREQAAEGRSQSEIAEAFGVSRRTVGRVVAGESHPPAPLDVGLLRRGGVSEALAAWLADRPQVGAGAVRAAAALSLAAQLDGAEGRDAAALARQLAELLGDLEAATENREPDRVDELVARRRARLLAGGGKPQPAVHIVNGEQVSPL